MLKRQCKIISTFYIYESPKRHKESPTRPKERPIRPKERPNDLRRTQNDIRRAQDDRGIFLKDLQAEIFSKNLGLV